MASTKTKSIETRAKFDEAVDEIARLQVRIAAVKAKRDKDTQQVADKYAGELDPLEDKRDLLMKLAEEYADDNRGELFNKGVKSAETTQSLFGFKIGNVSLKPLNSRWNWDKISDALREKFSTRFLRVKEDPDKEKLNDELDDGALAEVGIRREQKDRFYVEPKVETGGRVVAG